MNNKLKNVVLTGIFSALIFVATFAIKVPVASGYVHFGDSLIYMAACLIGPWGCLAGAIGAGLADIIGGYAIYAPATIIIKALIALVFALACSKKEKLFSVPSVISSILVSLITVGGYFVADMIIDKSYAVADIPGNVIQGIGSAVIFIVMALALDTVKIKQKVTKSR